MDEVNKVSLEGATDFVIIIKRNDGSLDFKMAGRAGELAAAFFTIFKTNEELVRVVLTALEASLHRYRELIAGSKED